MTTTQNKRIFCQKNPEQIYKVKKKVSPKNVVSTSVTENSHIAFIKKWLVVCWLISGVQIGESLTKSHLVALLAQ